MTLPEWTAAVSNELTEAGFEVEIRAGLPLVKIPKTHLEIVRFLKFKTTLAADKRLYAEGALFLPITVRGML